MVNNERLQEIKQVKEHLQTQMRGKEFKTLATKDKDLLLEMIAKMLGLIK